MTGETIRTEIDPPFAAIILSQPDKRNAVSAAMWAGLADAVATAEADETVRVVIIRGDGGHFAAGADITEFEAVYRTAESAELYTNGMLTALAALEQCAKPTIAQISGACVGGGCSIALAADFRFAGLSARFGVTPGKLGLVYSLADTRRLAAAAGLAGARDLLLSGRLIDAGEARGMGLCDRVFEEADLEIAVKAYGRDLAALSPFSQRATKAMLLRLRAGAPDDDPAAAALLLEAFTGADFAEGYRAFLEKRPPRF